MEVHLDKNSIVISHQIVYLPLKFAEGAVHNVGFWAVPILYHATILIMPFYINSTLVLSGMTALSHGSIPNFTLFLLLLFLLHL